MNNPVAYPFVFRKAVDSKFIEHVTKLTMENADQFKDNQSGANRKFMKMDYVTPEGDKYLYDVKQALAKHYDLGDYVVPPNLKDFIGYITEGGSIHPHKDPDLPGRRHVRINVLVKQSQGCIPLLEDIPIEVAEGDAWLNLASQCLHATTPVEGPSYRSAISFGYQIDKKRGDELYVIHKRWLDEIVGGVAD
jgi:hypothetical protein